MERAAPQTSPSERRREATPSFVRPVRLVQRACSCGGEADEHGECAACRSRRLQREAAAGAASVRSAPPVVDRALAEPGAPLPAPARSWAEATLGQSFADVRVHTGALAAEAARSVGARAYAVGREIVFGAGEFAPDTQAGRRLLGHELAHTVQQAGAPATGPLELGDPDSQLERDADRAAAGDRVALRAPRLVQRQRANEPAGGCATCQSASVAGTAAHVVAEELFVTEYGSSIVPEAAFDDPRYGLDEVPAALLLNPSDAENGRLDLLRVDMSSVPAIVEIGELKPDNDNGVRDGARDLEWYRDQLVQVLHPPAFVVSFLDAPAPTWAGEFSDRPMACPPQLLSVRKAKLGAHAGLYLYSCDPPGAEIDECCEPHLPPVPVRRPQEAEEKRPFPIDPLAFAYALAGTGAGAAALKWGPRFLPGIGAPTPGMQPLGAGAGGGNIAFEATGGTGGVGASGAATTTAAETTTAATAAETTTALEAGAAGTEGGGFLASAGELAPRAGILGIAAAISIGGGIKLAEYTYGSVVPGFVALGLDDVYKEMRAAQALIARWRPPVEDAYIRWLGASGDERFAAGSDILGALRPLHGGMYRAWRAVAAGVRQVHAIETRIGPYDVPQMDFDNIRQIMDAAGGYYPAADSMDLHDLTMFMLSAVDTLSKLMQRLEADRTAIIDEESHWVMKH